MFLKRMDDKKGLQKRAYVYKIDGHSANVFFTSTTGTEVYGFAIRRKGGEGIKVIAVSHPGLLSCFHIHEKYFFPSFEN